MIVCGIDPGTETSGVCVWDTAKQVILFSQSDYINDCIILKVIDNRDIDRFVVEDITCYGMPVGEEVFETCKLIGRLQERLDNPVVIAKRYIQLHFCNTTRAKDANITRVLKDRFGEKGTKGKRGITYGLKSHSFDAFALCIYYQDVYLKGVKGGK